MLKKVYHILVGCVLIIILPNQLHSQKKTDDSYFDYIKQTTVNDANHLFYLGLGFIQAPFHFNEQDWLYVLGTGISTTSLFLIDPAMKSLAQSNHSAFNDKIFQVDDIINGQTGMYSGAGLYLTGFIFKEEKIRMLGFNTLVSLFISNSITSHLKYISGRRRPYGGDDHMRFKIFRGSKHKFRSFPSGHVASAFAFGSVMAMSVDNIYWKSFWYGGATMVALSRIYGNWHWASDTFLAAVISYNVADFVVHFENSENNNFSIVPFFNGFQIRLYF